MSHHFLPLFFSLPRGNWISHTYFKTFSASTFCSGLSFSSSFSGTKKWMLDLGRVVLFCCFFSPTTAENQHGMNMKPALQLLYQLGPSHWIIPEVILLRFKKVTKCWLLFSISFPHLIVSLPNLRFISLGDTLYLVIRTACASLGVTLAPDLNSGWSGKIRTVVWMPA